MNCEFRILKKEDGSVGIYSVCIGKSLGSPSTYSKDPISLNGESEKDLGELLKLAIDSLSSPVLKYGEDFPNEYYNTKSDMTLEEVLKAFPTNESCLNHLRLLCEEPSISDEDLIKDTLYDHPIITVRDWFIGIWLFSKLNGEVSESLLESVISLPKMCYKVMLNRLEGCY